MATPLRLLDTHTHSLCIFQRVLLRNHLKNQMNECLRSDLFYCLSFAVATTSKQYDTFIGDKVQVHAYYYLFKFESKSRFKATGKCLVLTSAFGIFVLLLKNELKNERHTGELIPYDLAIFIRVHVVRLPNAWCECVSLPCIPHHIFLVYPCP